MSHADVIFTGGPVFTGTGQPQHGLAVLVRDGAIVALVPEAQADAHRGAGTRVVELEGALLSPSFQDAHLHPMGGGLESLQCDLTEATDAADAVARVARYAAEHPDAEWIVGAGWSMDHFPGGAPSRHELDAVTGERPTVLASRDHHSAWANTAAIALAGLDASTPDPADGRLEREPDGFPQGTFHEGAEHLFAHLRPHISEDQALQGLLAAQEDMLALGITGWQDAWVGSGMAGIQDIDAVYRRAAAEGLLKVHVRGAQWWERDRGLEQIPEMVARRAAAQSQGSGPAYVPGTVKIMVDGVAENFTAAMLHPYHDHSGHSTQNSGLSFVDRQLLKDAVTALDAEGFQVHFHALGDRAVREALDALEAARAANGPSANRHHLAHLQMVDEEEVARFAQLDATANLQALWATHEEQLDELTLPFLRQGAEERHYPFGDLVRAGARLAAGSDWPVSSPDPLEALHIAVNRRYPGSELPPLAGPEQALDVATFLAAYTSGSARVNHRDQDTGSLAPGFLADLVILDPNPFALDAPDLHTVRVNSTWIQGAPVFESKALASQAADAITPGAGA
ncbi:amidohydrolase [Galactobacter caseinivorans]|uniref:Amidohydrolase n=1 Tax=Galactobacter caseinivorans TaxID=2676123 RepID=A0A496PJ14_9MICC|nr:amidohydrolase [Galactobacter caseinivorans]RKW70448.1 amidohydrolase [Galactobacter caseinivorans]